MNPKVINEDTLDRLAKAMMVKHSIGYSEAENLLGKFRLNLICDESVARSASLQAALLTAVNTGKRAFHGGVFVAMPPSITSLLNWPGNPTLNEIVRSLGANFVGVRHCDFSHTLYFGSATEPVAESLRVHCSGWKGGVVPADMPFEFVGGPDFATGGVLAGALGVAKGFLRVSGLSTRQSDGPHGVSLWRPDLDWSDAAADGPNLEILPTNLWILGLGHLGQAYIWNFSLLPYSTPNEASFVLQDFDRIVLGNYSSGLLCEEENIGQRKTRVCSEWLEDRSFSSIITERRFDLNTIRTNDEPFVACCGFDSAEPRRLLESAGFDLVVECALGADTARFDRIILHTFPDASKKAAEIWASAPLQTVDQKLIDAFKTNEKCGILAETLARKAVSTSFVGAIAGAFVAAEILRALHRGTRCELIQAQLRFSDLPGVVTNTENYLNRVARSGYTNANAAWRKIA
jgi:hypothetical protein